MQPMIVARPLMLYGPYGVFIHAGEHNRFPGGRPRIYRPRHCYSLWFLSDGLAWVVEAGRRRQVVSPRGLLLLPGEEAAVEFPAGAYWSSLRFDVVQVPRRRISTCAFDHEKPRPQPSPEAVWGISLPRLVPQELTASLQRTMFFCQYHWWQEELGHARANARLAQWLIEWVAWESRAVSSTTAPPAAAKAGNRREPGPGVPEWVWRAEDQARRGFSQGVTVKELAAEAGMSRSHFSRSFHRAKGAPPREFIRRAKLEQACELLRDSALSVRMVGLRCGWRSTATFCREFKKELGAPPGEWRRAHQL